jgi:RimJ/RimL family protein N-acetyltransferase
MGAMAHPWPLFDLRIRTPRLELRLPRDEDLLALAELARAGVRDPSRTLFLVDWDTLPSPAFERQFLRYWWQVRGGWTPGEWTLGLAAFAAGVPIGVQDVTARDFGGRRTVATGSWLGLAHQRQGYGTEMRAAVLWLAFEELGALAAESGFVEGNASSGRVSEKLGYQPNGVRLVAPRDTPVTEHLVRVTPETWRRDLVPVTVEGMDACRGLFGERELDPGAWATP